jgi:hypothetical protein
MLSGELTKVLHEHWQTDGLHPFGNGIPARPGMHNETTGWLKILSGMIKTPGWLGRQAALDFHGPTSLSPRPFQHDINFGSRGCSIETGLRSFRSHGQQIFNHKPFPTWPYDRMTG